ncbi:uncharacterized protein K452DRAFT_292524 [Aplosporella prunicola CBS 121167]|uniref:Enoyl reductase (ER) domain-containing protein n=1 Tax=Aplosporella prunicola CBS 121167 TaxID=1176127 RepID=A0A6A6AZS8_9PEZI|nr:uncharacterized protein K452DRAFT_292524 [Aplosporella prunicola CBS 121167]KAF2136277.1 hypothetical protein K452DRAFT_292524 [Aplosporella prunicola CBS 121167]
MSQKITTKQWILENRPTGEPVLDGPSPTFKLVTTELPPLDDDQVLCRVKYFSNDPGQRGFFHSTVTNDRLYVPPVLPGTPMRSGVIAEVVESTAATIPKGQLVMTLHLGSWSEHLILNAADCQLIPADGVAGLPITHFLGAFGGPGLTAYYGTKVIAAVQPDDVFVVSAAAGATGSMAVQIAAKLIGCKRVIGIAGSEAKCAWVRSLGAHECINYKSATFAADLARATDGYVDAYFDNVGGEILDLMLTRMKKEGRMAICGAISTYNSTEPTQLKNWFEIVSMRLNIRGFILLDWAHKLTEMMEELVQAATEGKIVLGGESETVVEAGIEDVPRTWMKLFEGGNTGKLITKLS